MPITQIKGVVDIGETDLINSSSTFSISKSKPNSIKESRKTKIKVNFNVMFITIVMYLRFYFNIRIDTRKSIIKEKQGYQQSYNFLHLKNNFMDSRK
jgi:hypothetical protein